ncbi:hypothetical protein P43SY_010593 [Pythium insidiosum]|uniref:Uncharacterized protein n=1 Tax=Pythium insidiosum TaxID=114742 RepID=A0AAD5LBF7_PYTIN|nr:hypothetical protein P43SY_010593 [Pythium insidiosum]
MMLRRLLDPEETARRRRLRARIVRRNRIKREIERGLEPKLRRLPKPKERTIHDYGWDPRQASAGQGAAGSDFVLGSLWATGTGATTTKTMMKKSTRPASPFGRASDAFLVGERLSTPPVLQGADQVEGRSTRRVRSAGKDKNAVPTASANGSASVQTLIQPSGSPVQIEVIRPSQAPLAKRVANERVRQRWKDLLQVMLIQRHEMILAKDPNRKWRQERLGLLLFRRGDVKRSAEHLIKAITLGAQSGICWRRLAECHMIDYEKSSDWDVLWDARAAYEQALMHVEIACNPYVLVAYARVLEALGSYVAALTVIAKNDKNKIQLYLVMARNYYDANQMERAIRTMEAIFDINPYIRELACYEVCGLDGEQDNGALK